MEKHPNILRVETGLVTRDDLSPGSSTNILDYSVYDGVPRWLRKIEEILRLDFYLAWRAKRVESQYDIIYAGSEKVALPLSFMRLQSPLVVVAHHLESPLKARFARFTGIAKRWAGIGYISNESKTFFIDYLGIPSERLFQYESAKYLDQPPATDMMSNGPIMSLGVAKRDYNTLIAALSGLPEYKTELFVSSKFGDQLRDRIKVDLPEWISFPGFVSDETLMKRYQNARFVVVPLEETTHNGAGINVALEAGAFGKAVIATRTGGMPTFVKDGETGILVPPNDVAAMQEAIRTLWTQPQLAHQMGLAGRRYMESHFNPRDVDSRFSELLNKIYLDQVSKPPKSRV